MTSIEQNRAARIKLNMSNDVSLSRNFFMYIGLGTTRNRKEEIQSKTDV